MDNNSYNTQDVKVICENKLKINFSVSKEQNGWYYLGTRKVCRITIPKGKKFIPEGTYSSMAKQLKLNNAEMDDMLKCTLSKAAYDTLLANRIQ